MRWYKIMNKKEWFVRMGNNFFMNDRFQILNILYENQVQIGEKQFVPVTQEELASLLKWSKAKVNKILNEVIEAGYVSVFSGTKGRYQITEKGFEAIKKYK